MNRRQFEVFLAVMKLPQVIDLIMCNQGLGREEAIESFYRSRTFDVLSVQGTDVWHLSPLTIYNMWLGEREIGVIEFPGECRWTGSWRLQCTVWSSTGTVTG